MRGTRQKPLSRKWGAWGAEATSGQHGVIFVVWTIGSSLPKRQFVMHNMPVQELLFFSWDQTKGHKTGDASSATFHQQAMSYVCPPPPPHRIRAMHRHICLSSTKQILFRMCWSSKPILFWSDLYPQNCKFAVNNFFPHYCYRAQNDCCKADFLKK